MSVDERKQRMREAYGEQKPRTLTYIAVFAIALPLLVLALLAQKPMTSGTELRQFASAAELKAFLKESQGGYGDFYGGQFQITTAKESTSSALARDYSTTNVQVAGVDEADIVKSDGRYLYIATSGVVVIVDAYPAESAKIVSRIETEKGTVIELFVNGDRLVVFWATYETDTSKPSAGVARDIYVSNTKTAITLYDISDRSKPAKLKDFVLDGNYFDSRMIGGHVYAVVQVPAYYYGDDLPIPVFSPNQKDFPEISYFPVPDNSYTYTNIVSLTTQNGDFASKVFLLGSSDILYVSLDNLYVTHTKRISPYAVTERLVEEVLLPLAPADVRAQISAIKSSSMSGFEKQAKIFDAVSAWSQKLSAEERLAIEKSAQEKIAKVYADIAKETEKTVVHKITLSNGAIAYQTSGEVPGHALNQFSMDEHNGYFRIATTVTNFGALRSPSLVASRAVTEQATQVTTSVTTASPSSTIEQVATPTIVAKPVAPEVPSSLNNVYVLSRDMKIVGTLEDLASGERIYSARFMGDRAYLVTFKKVDPLFVIDLKEPAQPRVLGKLKIPGYSDYLHPYDENHIIGIGKETVEAEEGGFAWYQGIKLSLFDVSDVAAPKELSKFNIGDRGTDSYALHDHKAFLFNKQKNLLVIPVLLAEINEAQYPGGVPPFTSGSYVWQGAYVLDVSLEKGIALRGRVSHDDNQSLLKSGYYYESDKSVKRALYIENVLYTVSGTVLKMNALDTLEETGMIEIAGAAPEVFIR